MVRVLRMSGAPGAEEFPVSTPDGLPVRPLLWDRYDSLSRIGALSWAVEAAEANRRRSGR